MPRRKKLPAVVPDYQNAGRSADKLLVQKSNPLQTLSETGMSLAEFKILDAYLARIDSHKPEARYVRFERGELEKLLGVSKIPVDELVKRLKGLCKTVEMYLEEEDDVVVIGLFEKATIYDVSDGSYSAIDLCCTTAAMEYIFNIESLGYLKYRLKNVIDLTSRYSYVLYLYLESNRFRKTWVEELDEIKTLLNCTADTYDEYKRFNDLILKKAQKELNEKTTLRFEYEPVRKGRKIGAIKFTLETKADFIEEEAAEDKQLNFEDLEEPTEEEVEYGSPLANLLGDAALSNEFSPEQVRVIQDILLQLFPYERNELKLCDYLRSAVNLMNLHGKEKPIRSRFDYLCKILKNELKKKEK